MNKTETKELETEINALTRKLHRKVIAYHRACGTQLYKDEKLGIQLYATATFGITCNKDGSFRKTCSLTIRDRDGSYPDLVDETKFKRGDWNPNKESIDE